VIAPATAEALNRIAERAGDALRAYTAGGFAVANDVNIARRAPEYASDPLSVAAPENAYFVTQGAHGARTYTRDGGFTLDGGALRGADGGLVLGYLAGARPGALPQPLRLPAADVALGRSANVRVESDGTLSYTRTTIDPRTAERGVERVTVGTLALARFPAGTQPLRLDDRHVAAPTGIAPLLGTPADGTFGGLSTYARDTGSVDVDTSLEKLSDAYRAFAALAAANKARGATEQTALDLLK
jgi:flagellar basal body rod protein FlgG